MARLVGMGNSTPAKKRGSGWEPYLDHDEELLWHDAPAGGFRVTISGLMQSAFGVFFFGFSIFWVLMASNGTRGAGGPAALFPLFGLPFVAVGFYLVFGHWIFDIYRRARTRYALTNKRAIIAERVFGKRLKSYPITKSKPITLVERSLSTVNFDEKVKRGNKGGSYTVDIGFQFIPDGPEVFKTMRELQHKLDRT